MREIDVIYLFSHLVQHHAPLKQNRAEMGRQQGKIVRRQRR
jgi:hypothetical protein